MVNYIQNQMMNPNQFLNDQNDPRQSVGYPVLQNPNQETVQNGILQVPDGRVSGNARGSGRPDNQIGRAEMLMRMGAAGVGASAQGGTAAIQALGQTYGDIQDANRQAEADAYNADMINRKAEALAAAKKAEKQETLDIENNQKVGDLRISLNQMQEAKRILQESENVTGKSGGDFWNRLVGSTVGNKEQADRLFLKKLKLDEVMARVAETKGAISNAEMKLFASSAPSDYDDESVWIAWLDRKMQMQEIFMNRILNPNARLTDLNAPLSETMPNMSMPEASAQYEVLEIEDETSDPE
jgi:hypothetical protein